MKNTFFFCFFLSFLFFACEKPPVEIEYAISSSSLNFEAIGGQAEFTVTVKSPAIIDSVKASDTWCRVSTNDASPMSVIVTVLPNTQGRVRNTSIVVSLSLDETITFATIPVSQKAAYIGEWVLINGVKWATCNVNTPGRFAAKPEDAGMFYQWNSIIGWSATDPMISSNGGTHWSSFGAEGEIWKKANDPCPMGWRVPTTAELHSLAGASSKWTTQNGVNGRLFGSDKPFLFLPAAGNRNHNNGTTGNTGTHGQYWSSSGDGANAFYLYFYDANIHANSSANRAYGFSVRCVQE